MHAGCARRGAGELLQLRLRGEVREHRSAGGGAGLERGEDAARHARGDAEVIALNDCGLRVHDVEVRSLTPRSWSSLPRPVGGRRSLARMRMRSANMCKLSRTSRTVLGAS